MEKMNTNVCNSPKKRYLLQGRGRSVVLILLLLLQGNLSFAQTQLTGTVKDTTGPIPGVSVSVKNVKNKGVITGGDGAFVIGGLSPGDVLVFSAIGYVTQEISVGSKKEINVVLESARNDLDEVVVIGYGTVAKKDLTGAVGAVSGEKVSKRNTTQISEALQGAVAGVTVSRSSSAPGTGASILIRGVTSIQESSPLVIVDGVPVSGINDVNPQDVDQISVLKDGASSSIYGSRAAAGVILITTKRGSRSGVNIDYSTFSAIERPTNMPGFVGATRYMQMQNELAWNQIANLPNNEFSIHPQQLIADYDALNAQDPDKYPNTKWLDYILKDHALRHNHFLSISGGDEKRRTKIGIGYDHSGGLFKYNLSYGRVTARINNDIKINKFISATVDVFSNLEKNVNPSYSPSAQMRYAAPIYAAEYLDGRLAEGKTGTNPYGLLRYGGKIDKGGTQLGGRGVLDVTPLEGLKLSVIFSPEYNFSKSKNFSLAVPYTQYDDPSIVSGFIQGANTTSLLESRGDNKKFTTQLIGNYNKSFGKHHLNAMAGYENFYSFYESLTASRDQYEMSYYGYLDAGPKNFVNNSGNAYEYAYRSYFGRLMYNYDNKYYLQANLRYDGSSRFHKDNRWGTFPSVSAGWVISQEQFMKNVAVISYLKLRGSWGQLGNERIGNYPYQSTLEFNTPVLYQGGNVVGVQGASAYQYAIKNISWETTESTNLGIDAQFLKSRLGVSFEVYKKTTKDMLLALQIPTYMGFSNPQQNAGRMHTKGWDLELSWNDKINDFKYAVSANLSDYRSVMGDLKGTEFLAEQVKFKGSEFNEWYGYKSVGIYQNAQSAAASARTANTITAGDIQYMDISGPNGVPDGVISPEFDRVLLGGSLPRYLFGANISASYKNFDFGMVIQGVAKQTALLTEEMVRPLRAQWYNIPDFVDGNYWSVYRTAAQNAAAKYPRLSDATGDNNYAMSDYWLFDGSYLRIKNISLGYTFDHVFGQKSLVKGARLYTNITDYFTFSKYPKGWDPEVSRTGYPITKSIVFGLSVKL